MREEDEGEAESCVDDVDQEHHKEGSAGVAYGAESVGRGEEDAEDGAAPAKDGEVFVGVDASFWSEAEEGDEVIEVEADDDTPKNADTDAC